MKRHHVIVALVVWSMAITIARGIYLPNDFAEAHWLIDYRHGFMKRGLVGTLVTLLAKVNIAVRTENGILVLACLAFVLFCLSLLYISFRVLRRYDWSLQACFAVLAFVTSFFVVYNASILGYLDHLFFSMAIAAAWLALRDRYWAAGAVSAVAVLVHESYLAAGLPLVLLACYFKAEKPANKFRYLPMLLPIIVFLALAGVELFINDRVYLRRMMTGYLEQFSFIEIGRATRVPVSLTATFGDHLRSQSHHFLDRITNQAGLMAIFPILPILCLPACRASFRFASVRMLLIATISLLPLAMHAIAWDTMRIWIYAIFIAFAAVWVDSETSPKENCTRGWIMALLALGAIAVSLFLREPLIDDLPEHFSVWTTLLLYAPLAAFLLFLLVKPLSFAARKRALVMNRGVSEIND